MDTMLKLAGIMSASGSTEAAKLRPALFLAQQWTGVVFYGYHLAQGMVLSDELDQDLSQLISGGLVSSDFSSKAGLTFTPSSSAAKAAGLISESEAKLRDLVVGLLRESPTVLDAAATCEFFQRHDLGNPEERLFWFRTLPEADRERVRTLVAGTAA